jgi:hypothetical protein
MASLKLIYPSGAAIQTTYNAVKDFDHGHKIGYLETDDNSRAFDGTLNSYAGAKKRIYELTFSYVEKTQLDYFQMLWVFQCPIDLYLDGTNFDASVKIIDSPLGNSEKTPSTTYSFSVKFEEV